MKLCRGKCPANAPGLLMMLPPCCRYSATDDADLFFSRFFTFDNFVWVNKMLYYVIFLDSTNVIVRNLLSPTNAEWQMANGDWRNGYVNYAGCGAGLPGSWRTVELAHGQKIIGKVFAPARNTSKAGTKANDIANDITPDCYSSFLWE